MANDTLFRRFAPYKRKQTGDESPLLKEGVTARIAVTGDCLEKISQKLKDCVSCDSFVMLSAVCFAKNEKNFS